MLLGISGVGWIEAQPTAYGARLTLDHDGARRKKLRAYTVDVDECEGTIVGVIAENAKEARRIAYRKGDIDREWIYIKAVWRRGIDVSGLPKGIIAPYKGVQLGIYGWIEGTCPMCKKTEQLYLQSDGTITCNECYEDRAIIQQSLQPDLTAG